MTVIKYKTEKISFGGQLIEVVECERETDVSVFVKSRHGGVRREAKRSDWGQYHDSWEAARTYLIEREERGVRCAERRLQEARADLAKAQAIPEVQP